MFQEILSPGHPGYVYSRHIGWCFLNDQKGGSVQKSYFIKTDISTICTGKFFGTLGA